MGTILEESGVGYGQKTLTVLGDVCSEKNVGLDMTVRSLYNLQI